MAERLTGINVLRLTMDAGAPLATPVLTGSDADAIRAIRQGMKTSGPSCPGTAVDDSHATSRSRPIMRINQTLVLLLITEPGTDFSIKQVDQSDAPVKDSCNMPAIELGFRTSQARLKNL